MRLHEISPNSLAGSYTQDLILSKIWLIKEVAKIKQQFDSIYVLGSWYGNVSLMLISKNIKFDRIFNVDVDRAQLAKGQELADRLGVADRIVPMVKDANDLDFRHATEDSLIINTSCNEIENRGWFDNIPQGALVALEARTNSHNEPNKYTSLDDFKADYDLDLAYEGQRELEDPQEQYIRFLLIGAHK